jgi:alkylated DNA repair dioxygenase AlkB
MENLIQTNKSFLKTIKSNNIKLLQNCVEEVDSLLLVNPPIKVFDKICYQNRSVGFFSDESIGYKYSGQIMNSQPLTQNLNNLLEETNKLFKSNYNGILVNKYTSGKDYIGPHSDDESGLDKSGVVAISFGESRKFRIRDKKNKKIVLDIPTQEGMYLQMGGEFQKEFTHEIPKQLKINGTRFSFTFRKHTI